MQKLHEFGQIVECQELRREQKGETFFGKCRTLKEIAKVLRCGIQVNFG